MDEEPSVVFQKLKKIRTRNKWDINLERCVKSPSLENTRIKVIFDFQLKFFPFYKKKHYVYTFDRDFGNPILPWSKNFKKNQRRITVFYILFQKLNFKYFFLIRDIHLFWEIHSSSWSFLKPGNLNIQIF